MAARTAKPIDDLLEFWSAVAKQMAEMRKMANCGRSAWSTSMPATHAPDHQLLDSPEAVGDDDVEETGDRGRPDERDEPPGKAERRLIPERADLDAVVRVEAASVSAVDASQHEHDVREALLRTVSLDRDSAYAR